ncbi:MAG: ABC transporter ATP-binding protein [Cellulosilyticum sp.]|nr:ABC transporter ATP-binding protein [Cellulosilyticum sp.]
MAPIIKIHELRKIYRMGSEKIVALNHINLEIEKGEICCLFGTSGSGKSTLLNMLAGLEKPTKGSVQIKKIYMEKLSETQLATFRQRYIGFVFQSYNLIPTLTAQENVALPLVFQGVGKKEREKKAKEILEAVGLGKRLKHKPKEMSGGQQQRVSIARAFVNQPQIIFADEPTGNLDTHTTIEVMDMMTQIARKYNQTLIIVSHDPEIAEYADRIITMQDGDILKIEKNTEGRREITYEKAN